MRATTAINKVFSFNECSPVCGCNKNVCLNYLVNLQNKKTFKTLVRRIKKSIIIGSDQEQSAQKRSNAESADNDKKEIHMWGLFAMEDIPAGAFLMEYKGEIVTKKHGDMRGKIGRAHV